MSFSVDTAALARLPDLLQRLGDDARASRDYLARHSDLKGGEGLFNIVLGGHRTAIAHVSAFLDQLIVAAGGQADNVRAAADLYATTDARAAAALDATMPTVPDSPRWPHDRRSGQAFADRAEPQGVLAPPPDYTGEYSFEFKYESSFSPASYVRWLIWEVTALAAKFNLCDRPIDIYLEFVIPWLGDWAALRACADVYATLAHATAAMSANVNGGASDSGPAWSGNAADACRRDLADTGHALAGARARLQELEAEYVSVSETTLKQAEAVAGLLVVATDMAVMALLALEAAAASAPTIGGAVAGAAAAGAAVWKLIETISKIADCYKIAHYGAKAFAGALEGFSVVDPGDPLPAVSGGGPLVPAGR
jgi:hypothetical protein